MSVPPVAAIQSRPAVHADVQGGLEDVAVVDQESVLADDDLPLDQIQIELEDQRMTDFINNFSEITTQIHDQIRTSHNIG